jgi:drug/metabolite transporter (DMT)-like permease
MASARAGTARSRARVTSAAAVHAGRPRRDLVIGIVCAVATVAIWSGFILISRASAGRGSLLPTDLAALRFGVAAAIMLPVLLWRLRSQPPAAALGMSWQRALVVALTAGCGFSLFAFSAFMFERVGRQRAIGLALILAGIVTLGFGTFLGLAPRMLLGDLLFLCASTSWALFVVYARKWQLRPVDATIALSCGAALLYLPLYALFLPKRIDSAPLWEVLGQGFYQGTFSVVLSTIVYTRVLMTFGATRTAMITAVVPGTVALLAVPVLGEPLSVSALLGLVLVTAGMVTGVVTFRR